MKTVVIIIGAGRSGSTLLAKALGGHSNGFALGEINRFNNEINMPETQCGCGERLNECCFWTEVLEGINLTFNSKENRKYFVVDIFKELTKSFHFFKLIPTIFFNKIYKSKLVNKKIDDTFKLYDTLFEKTNSKLLIDSSKGLFRALVLASRSPKDIQFKFIHLVRDGRGVLNSSLKSSYKINHKDGSKRIYKGKTDKDPVKMINNWLYINLRNYLILKLFRKKATMFIHYEVFTSNPSKYLKNIYDWIDLDYEEKVLDLGGNENHILGGNASRINAHKIKRQDDAWREKLDQNLINKFNKRAGWFNRLIGYK